jgi:hypothetical protein
MITRASLNMTVTRADLTSAFVDVMVGTGHGADIGAM